MIYALTIDPDMHENACWYFQGDLFNLNVRFTFFFGNFVVVFRSNFLLIHLVFLVKTVLVHLSHYILSVFFRIDFSHLEILKNIFNKSPFVCDVWAIFKLNGMTSNKMKRSEVNNSKTLMQPLSTKYTFFSFVLFVCYLYGHYSHICVYNRNEHAHIGIT